MAQGDVTVTIITKPFTASDVDTWVTAARVTANDKWLMAGLDSDLIIVHIEEV